MNLTDGRAYPVTVRDETELEMVQEGVPVRHSAGYLGDARS